MSNYTPSKVQVKRLKPAPQITPNLSMVKRVAGVTPSQGSAAPVVTPQSVSSVTQKDEKLTPLEAYEQAIKKQLENTSQHTEKIKNTIKTKTGMKFKYGQPVPAPANPSNSSSTYSGSNSWGGFKNGHIPTSALQQIAPGHYLRSDAANAFSRLNAAFRRTFGRNISITDSYRPYAVQVRLARTKPGLAATPGRSNHGWGVALDLGGGINRHGTREHEWMRRNAAHYGFGPLSGRMYRLEPWHWEYRG